VDGAVMSAWHGPPEPLQEAASAIFMAGNALERELGQT
jgi:hypothetical protein